MATLLSFTNPRPHGWSNEEKAQFARICKLLSDAGVAAEIDLGVTDEGDPWCAVCSGTSDDVIIHIARVDGLYLFDSAVLPTMIKGRSLNDCAQRFIDDATVLARRPQHGSTVFMHPSAVLAGVILTIFLYFESTGDGAAQSRIPLIFDPVESDIIDVSEDGEAAPVAETAMAAAPVAEEADSPLLALKQMLQQIAEAVQKQEGDRAGAQGASLGQNWGTALLSSGAVVAAIAYAQDTIIDLPGDGEADALPYEIAEAGAGHAGTAPAGSDEEARADQSAAHDVPAADVAAAGAPPARPDTVDARPEDFMSAAEVQATAVADRADRTQEKVLIETLAEDRFVFVQDGPVEAPQEAQDAPAETPASVAPDMEAAALSSIVQFMSSSSIRIRDEVLDLGDFIQVVAEEPSIVVAAVATAIPAPVAPVAIDPLPAPVPVAALPVAQSDAFVFAPAVPKIEAATIQHVSHWITDFVKVTGLLRYDMTDRFNLSIYDSSVIGQEDSTDVVSRSFTLQDDSIVTFFGFSDEIDSVFAA